MRGRMSDLVRHPSCSFRVEWQSLIQQILDIFHNLWLLSMHGELGLSPKAMNGAKRVLDVGTGTGIWAIEYGMKYRLRVCGTIVNSFIHC